MVIEALYHNTKNNYSYAINNETIALRLRAKKGDTKQIFIHAFDKYDFNANHQIISMSYELSDKYFDYFIGFVKPRYKRLSYFFEIRGKRKEVIYMTEENFYTSSEDFLTRGRTGYFEFPFINKTDVNNTPKWVEKAIFYQIFPDRFQDGDKTNNPVNVAEWGSTPSSYNYAGGDILGIISKIPYLEELGINAIYLNPIFESVSNHHYDTIDYMSIDHRLGDKTIFRELVEVCHRHNIKLIIDIAINHCSSSFLPFIDVVEHGEKSKYKDWFNIHNYPIYTKPMANYDTFAFNKDMPKLNFDNHEVRAYFIDVIKYWVGQYQLDGIRLDVANEMPHSFLRELRNEVKTLNEDAFIIGEIWHNAMPWLNGDQLDSITNYRLKDAITNLFAHNSINVSEFKHLVASNFISYPTNVANSLLNIIDSHDTKRFLTETKENKDKFKQAVLFQMTVPGVPCIYYGDEIGLVGEADPDCRKCMYWDSASHDTDLLEFYQQLIKMRKDNYAITRGSFSFIDLGNNNLLSYIREYRNKSIIIIINCSSTKIRLSSKVMNKYNIIGNNIINAYGYKIVINDTKK